MRKGVKNTVKKNTGEMYVYGKVVIQRLLPKFCEVVMWYQIVLKKGSNEGLLVILR